MSAPKLRSMAMAPSFVARCLPREVPLFFCIPIVVVQRLRIPTMRSSFCSSSSAAARPLPHLFVSTDVSPGKLLEFSYAKRPSPDFCSFIDSTPRPELVDFFRSISMEVEMTRKIRDFHLRIVNGEDSFKVNVYYGVKKSGPVPFPLAGCISCHPNAPLFPREDPELKAKDCILEEFGDERNAVCRLDAKGRSGFVITPVRHVERMSDLNDEELVDLWKLAVRALRNAELPFANMRLNHGTYRNLEHLHLKVWVDEDMYKQYTRKWDLSRQQLWNRLRQLAAHRKRMKTVVE